ncbi:MAG: SDR family oxidoreductase [Gammaproteobacteria bacterium]|nr:SDR family oxidoreductase [Gammaproteobacteria bacterium]MBT7371318.1 SDR family oxidoreductase [Gammaproteobacteria bacterium]
MGILDGKVGIILGASSGIGWRIAERFVEEGAELIIAARREDQLAKLAEQIGAHPMRCDASEYDDVKALADAATEKWGRLDFSINSAGLNKPSMIADITPELLHEVAAVQFFGSYYFMKHMANAHAAGGGGSLINITSATAIMVPMGLSPYSGCKAAANFVTKIAAREYGTAQVRVNALAPTFVPTAMNAYGGMTPVDDARVDLDSSTPISEAFINETPLARITTVDDCADVAVFLASDLSSSITGQVVPVDCGNHLMRLPTTG